MKLHQKYMTTSLLFLVVVLGVCAVLYPTLEEAFVTNWGLNGLILLVLIVGVIFSLRQISHLTPAVRWVNEFRKADSLPDKTPPKILAPMAAMIAEDRNKGLSLSALSMRTLLDGIAARMDEGRENTRYIIGLLIFLGLLGTFWGLLGTIGSIKDTIDSLSVGSSDISVLFEDLKQGLAAPLGGMGTAFSSSLFGLAGSVMLGFIDLQTGQAQSRFFNDLEDWLSGATKLSRGSSLGLDTGDASVPAYVSALLEQSADSLEKLHDVIVRSEENRTETGNAVVSLSEQLASLADSQGEMRTIMKKVVELLALQSSSDGERSSLGHLRNIDVQMKHLTEETIKGQDKLTEGLRSEVRLLARTLGAAVDGHHIEDRPAPPPEPPKAAKEEVVVTAEVESPPPPPPTAAELDYDMPTPKPKGNKKPVLTAKRDD